MSAPAAHAPDEADATLVPIPSVIDALRRSWPRVLLRAAVVVLLPLCVAQLADALQMVGTLDGFMPELSFLVPPAAGGDAHAYVLRVIAFLTLILVGGAFVLPRRTGQLLLGIATLAILGFGFNHSRLRWAELFIEAEYIDGAPSAAAWTWGALLLATLTLYVLLDGVLDTRRAQAERGMPDDETRATQRVAMQGAGLALASGAFLVLALLGLGALLSPRVEQQTLFPRLNPVYVLLALGVLLALAIVLAGRRARPPATR